MGDPQTPMLPAGKTPAPPSITVVICVYTERRWSEMLAAVGSALAQSLPPSEVVVVVDHNPALLERLRAELADVAGIRPAPRLLHNFPSPAQLSACG